MAKFLSYEDLLEIESGLKEDLTFTEIGKKLGRDRTTITKEVRNYAVELRTGYSVYPHNVCKYRKGCKRRKVCGTNECKHPMVTPCRQCEEEVCTSRFKAPYVCNECSELMFSEKTLYNYIDGSLFDVRNIDLPRKVKYRPRYKRPELKVDRGCRMGRNYHDYEVYLEKHPDTAVTQMDSVIGSKGGKVLLTVFFVETSLMLAFLRDANTSKSVMDVYDELYNKLGGQDFRKLFPIILTDNGSEFSNPKSIEYGADGKGFHRNRVYYCNPSAPYQKAEIEVGHEFIRRVLPKGKSFDELMQEDINLMMDHINSYRRKKLNEKSPYEAFCFYYGKDLADKLGCHEVAANSINLTPGLMKK